MSEQAANPNTPATPQPVQKGDWVMEKEVMHPELGRVLDCYWIAMDNEWVMDVSLYSADGKRIGRSSPACGGPRSFEPAIPCKMWERIEKPSFPMERDETGYRCWRAGATVLLDRT